MDFFATLVSDPSIIVSGIAAIAGVAGSIFVLKSLSKDEDVASDTRQAQGAAAASEDAVSEAAQYSDDNPLGLVGVDLALKTRGTTSGYKRMVDLESVAKATAEANDPVAKETGEGVVAQASEQDTVQASEQVIERVVASTDEQVCAQDLEEASEHVVESAIAEAADKAAENAVEKVAENVEQIDETAAEDGDSAARDAETEQLQQPELQSKPSEQSTPSSPSVQNEQSAQAEIAADVALQDELDKPEALGERLERLRSRLGRSGGFGRALLGVLSRGDLAIEDWEDMEDQLLMADLGMDATEELIDYLRTEVKVRNTNDPQVMREVLREKLLELVSVDASRELDLAKHHDQAGEERPAAILVVGVNGVGKTTFIGKLSRALVAQGKKVLLGAADTFRAAAVEQLATWGSRVGVEVVYSERENADPASVAFDAIAAAKSRNVDVVVVDTAGRLQNKSHLMEELGKVKRVMSRDVPVNETLIVLDATTGQNGLQQARVFAEVVDVTGIILTKLDGSAKGGVVVSVQRELGVPVKFVGLGEGPDDLAPFDPEVFVDEIVGR